MKYTEEEMGRLGFTEDEKARARLVPVINGVKDEAIAGQKWDTQQLQQDFEVLGFSAPFCVVRRKSDGKMGSLTFRSPRVYFDFVEKD